MPLRRLLIGILTTVVAAISGAAAAQPQAPATAQTSTTVLILATGASKMTSGKPTGLWLEEFAVPYNVFTRNGYRVISATLKGGEVPIDPRSNPTKEQEAAWSDAAAALKVTQPLAKVRLESVDAIFIPGGHGVMFDLASSPEAARVIGQLYDRDKVVAAVCHGPAALVNVVDKSGKLIVAGKNVSAFTDEEEAAVELTKEMPFLLETKLRTLGAKLQTGPKFEPKAVRDGNLITGQNPPSSELVANLVIQALSEARTKPKTSLDSAAAKPHMSTSQPRRN